MATITSNGTGGGLWSAGATWAGGSVPVDNDAVVIASGDVVEFNVDQSGFANGIDGLTITGTLKLTRTAGTYYMKIKAAKTINGAGTFDCGTSGSPIPFATKHTITGGNAWYIDGTAGLSVSAFGTAPSIRFIKLSANEAAGQTVLSVDTDVTGVWNDGDTILIGGIESRVIAAGGIASNEITVTTGLTAAKYQNQYIFLANRNVTFISVAGALFWYFYNTKLTLGECGFTGNSGVFRYAGAVTSGGIYYMTNLGGWNQADTSDPIKANGTIFIGTSFYTTGHEINNCYLIGCASLGNGSLISNSYLHSNNTTVSMVSGVIESCYITAFGGSGWGMQGTPTIYNTSFVGYFNRTLPNFFGTLYNCLIEGNEVNYYSTYSPAAYTASYDHDQVAGIMKFWTQGGISITQTTTKPTGYASSVKTTFESATKYGWWKKEITIGAGASVNITMNLRKDASMAYLPRVIIFNRATTDPFAGGAGLHTFTMTNSVDTWESDVYTYTNTTGEDITLVVRCQGMNATGNMYSALNIEQINVDLTNAIALITAVKAKTDQLAFTVANQVDANALTGGLTQADVRTAVGLATANLDSQLSAIDTDVLGAVVEGSYTVQDILKIMAAVLAGKASGGGTTNIKFRDLSDTLDRIDETVDSNGNRTSVTRNTA